MPRLRLSDWPERAVAFSLCQVTVKLSVAPLSRVGRKDFPHLFIIWFMGLLFVLTAVAWVASSLVLGLYGRVCFFNFIIFVLSRLRCF